MNHELTPDQRESAKSLVDEIVELENKELLIVPSDPFLSKEWFIDRAAEIISAVGGIKGGDIFCAMGQQQLVMALNSQVRKTGAQLVESTTERVGQEVQQPDGSVKKTYIFKFVGFRDVYEF